MKRQLTFDPDLCLTCNKVLDTPEPLRNLAELIAAQLEFHKRAYEILAELAPVVDGLQEEQEVSATISFTFSKSITGAN